jgi:hypothetical protein
MVDHNVIRINHYRFRYGLQSFKKRRERGFAGNFKGASGYAKLNISNGDPWIQNVTQDFAMVETKQKLKGLMTAVPSSEKKKLLRIALLSQDIPSVPLEILSRAIFRSRSGFCPSRRAGEEGARGWCSG